MASFIEQKLMHYPRQFVTDNELVTLLQGSPDSRYGKIKRLLAQGKLLHIRKGIYCLTDKLGYTSQPHPFELAQHIYAPSYISLEAALSYHQLIPERVYTITSVTGKRSKEFNTPLGLFSYSHVPLENLLTQVDLIQEENCKFLIARPWKAICDYIYCNKCNWTNLDPLEKSLRIEIENLPNLRYEEITLLDEYYHQKRISLFLKNIYEELQNER